MTRTIHAVRAGAVVLLATTLGACATTQLGREFDDAYAQQIKPGVTTKAEIRARLGRPPLVQATDNHDNDIWTYAYLLQGRGLMVEIRPTGGTTKETGDHFQG